MYLKKIYATLTAFCAVAVSFAQTSNFGDLVVKNDTQFSTYQPFVNIVGANFINDGETLFYSDLTNNGVVDYTRGSNGVVEFSSNKRQNIAGSEFCFFNNVVFNNTTFGVDNIRLNTTISIANEANFTHGIVNSESATGGIIFENNALAYNASNDSFVDGTVEKQGNVAFDFPIGDLDYYRPASISEPLGVSSVVTAKYHFENVEANYPVANRSGVIELIDDSEYWTIENPSGNEEVFITLSWDANNTSATIIEAPQSAIHIVRWDEAQKIWVSEGGVVNAATNTITTRAALSDYGVFTLGRVNEDLILPGGGVIYTAISPNGDGINDYFLIDNISDFANNKVEIYNRWGTLVFSTTNYDTTGNVFGGIQEVGKPFLNNPDGYLPTGTYFFVIIYDYIEDNSTQTLKKTGYLYINAD